MYVKLPICVIAKHKNTPVKIIVALVNKAWGDGYTFDYLIRKAAAGNTHTPPALLARLARDKAPRVLEAAAGNVNTPLREIIRLAKVEKDNFIGDAASGNPSLLQGQKT